MEGGRSPISAPPIAAETGVKLSMTSPLHTLRLRCVEATLSTPFDRDLGSGDYHAIREIFQVSRLGRRRDEKGRHLDDASEPQRRDDGPLRLESLSP